MLRIRPLYIVLAFLAVMGSAVGKSQPIISQPQSVSLTSDIPATGSLSYQYSAFIVGEKPIALNNIVFTASNKTASKKMEVAVFKGMINGNSTKLTSKVSGGSVTVPSGVEYNKFTVSLSENIVLDAWTTYFIVMHTASEEGAITVGLAPSIGAVKSTGVTLLSGVYNQNHPTTAAQNGLVDNVAFIGVSLNGPAGAPPAVAPPSFSLQKFAGNIQRGRAMIQWKVENAETLRDLQLEKGLNEKDFAVIPSSFGNGSGSALDLVNGKVFYRIRFTDLKGVVTYSNVLKVEPKGYLTAKPLQTQILRGQNIRMELSASENTNTVLTIVNRFGQPVKKISQQVMSGISNIQIASADLMPGNYYVNCSTAGGEYSSQSQIIVF